MNPASEDASRRARTCSIHFAPLHYSPYDDPTELAVASTPLLREYRAIGVIDDEEIGQPSGIVSVTFAG